MARNEWEDEIVHYHFPLYTNLIKYTLDKFVAEKHQPDTSDDAINLLLVRASADLAAILETSNESYSTKDADLSTAQREYLRDYIERVRSYEAHIQDASDEEVDRIYSEGPLQVAQDRRKVEQKAIQDRERWAPFNRPEAEVDFTNWQGRLLSPEQAAALLLGKEPKAANTRSLARYRTSPFEERFKELLSALEGAVREKALPDRFSLNVLGDWANELNLPLPPLFPGSTKSADVRQLENELNVLKSKLKDAEDRIAQILSDETALPHKSQATLMSIILGVAIDKFGHQPVGNSKATTNIASALSRADYKVTEGSIRDWLTYAHAFLDKSRLAPVVFGEEKVPRKPKPLSKPKSDIG